ncbi:MAG: alpha/beta fold hydrolase [Spongiibacteraceae bacterium]
MSSHSPRLALPLSQLQSRYQVVVVGSGYGAGVAASRLARAGQGVCVLERGREFAAGEFPDTLSEAAQEFQVDLVDKHLGKNTGLYDLRVNPDMNVMLGCGLGGTSLLNASVALRADPRVFDDPCWPAALRTEARQQSSPLATGYARAEKMLRPQTYPDSYPALPKMAAHQKSALLLGKPFYRTPINVTFKDGVNHVGVQQNACVNCGDCVSGCNHAAKNTTNLNYLPDAVNFGAQIFTEVKVSRLEKNVDADGRTLWRVYFTPQELGREKFSAPELFVLAETVVLGAGTLGSTEILLRSRARGLALSDQLGKRFTGNGDVLGFAYNGDSRIDGVGFGDNNPEERDPVGPCITSVIDARATPKLDDGSVIEEGSLPGALAPLLPAIFAAAATLTGRDSDEGFVDKLREKARELESQARGAWSGAMRNTQTFLVMAHDGAAGQLALQQDRIRIEWPGVGSLPRFKQIAEELMTATTALGGTAVPNPVWNKLMGHDLVTVHPLGGCAMSDDASSGVVNGACQVFVGNGAGNNGAAIHEGLYVCDGAVVPRSLGINPLLTITALAERACLLLAQRQGWADGWSETSTPGAPLPARQLGIQFTETMRGHIALFLDQSPAAGPQLDFAEAEIDGKNNSREWLFTVTVVSDDLEQLLNTEAHPAALFGTVIAPALHSQPLTVLGGGFQLFVRDADVVGQRRMVYRMPLLAEDGRRYFLSGYKLVRDQRGFDTWGDTTTLYITLYDGDDEKAPLLGRGVLHIAPEDFAKQMTTMRARNATDTLQGLSAVTRFGRYFAGVLAETYTKGIAPLRIFNPEAPPRPHRPLRCGDGEVIAFTTGDGVPLRLTRYRGGNKGPVMLAHGLGVSSRIFSLDTIDTNLLEYLYAHGYDVWLLDFRASIELPAAHLRANGDDVAREDFPAAVARIRAVTGAASIQVVAHCFGASTFVMAMLGGLQGVRSAVLSQVGSHYKPPLLSTIKAGLYLPDLLDKLGIDSLTAYRDTHADWYERLFDEVLRLYPQEFEERTNSPVDRRIAFLYGQLWELDQLNTATHDSLHELFGVANIAAFEHLALLLRKGSAVNAAGDDVYLPHVKRLAIPIRLIHGAENQTFLPESTKLMLRWLQQANGAALYDRIEVPKYGHIDCIFGKNAVVDVYPLLLAHLEKTAVG